MLGAGLKVGKRRGREREREQKKGRGGSAREEYRKRGSMLVGGSKGQLCES